jgi:excinuclease ABC subunit A
LLQAEKPPVVGVRRFGVVVVDQGAIGSTPASNPATYSGMMSPIREFFAALPESRAKGFKSGRFSFNVAGGRCEACEGKGQICVEMHFLADVWVTCEVCRGKRYNAETLQVAHRGKTIADVLDMEVAVAREFFTDHPRIERPLRTLEEVGLGYVRLGQPATTLSGGEAQRLKLAARLAKPPSEHTIHLLDEPTTGLHMDDVKKLIEVLDKLVARGDSVIVIEHHLDVIKCADHVIELGPEGGEGGGRVVIAGTPEEVAACAGSHTGRFLAARLAPRRSKRAVASGGAT